MDPRELDEAAESLAHRRWEVYRAACPLFGVVADVGWEAITEEERGAHRETMKVLIEEGSIGVRPPGL